MLKQIIHSHANKFRQDNGLDQDIVTSIAAKTGINESVVMQILDSEKYAAEIQTQALIEQYQNEQDRLATQQAALEAKAIADAVANQAKQAAQAQLIKAQQQKQDSVATIKQIYDDWMKAPVAHNLAAFYRYAQNDFGLDYDTVQSAVADKPWFLLE